MGTITADRFAGGMTYDEFKASMTRNRDKVEANEARVRIPTDDLAALKAARPLHVVALGADWCGDVIANLPVLARMARDGGKLDLRLFERDANDDLMSQYLNQGKYKSIPVWAFFDEGWNEVGVFIERPDAVTEMRARLQAELQKMRDDTADEANAAVIREIRAIVEGRSRWGGVRQPAQSAKGA